MGCKRSRAVVAGLGAAAAAVGSAAIMCATTAPIARADLTADITAELADAQTAYNTAAADFAAGGDANWAAGLNALYEAQDDQFFGVPFIQQVEATDALLNQPVTGIDNFNFVWPTPDNLTDATTEAQTISALGNTDMTTAANDFAAGDWTDGTLYNDLGTFLFTVEAWQVYDVGQLEAFLTSLPST
jgi:hypothetical protein